MDNPTALVCRRCREDRPVYRRGLCHGCYADPAARAEFPSERAYGRRGIGRPTGMVLLPDAPTAALPGTPEKLATLAERAARNQLLFHPADATYDTAALTTPTRRADDQEPFRTHTPGERTWPASGRT